MRYSKEESTYILAVFNSGDTVTIDIYRLSDNTKVVEGASCSEIGSTGIFKYEFSQVITQKEEFLWIMSNGSYSKYGKIVLGGWMDDVKVKTDKLQFNTDNDVKATLDGERVKLDVDTENMIRIILGMVQHNYRLFNIVYTTIAERKKLSSATIKIYNTKEDCENDINPIKTYTLSISYDDNGYIIDYKCVEE